MAEVSVPEPIRFIDNQGQPVRSFEDPLTEEELKKVYYLMKLSRVADEKAAAMVKQGRSFFYAMSSGHEAAQVGSVFALFEQDWLFPYHRSTAVVLARGLTPFEFFSEVMGKRTSLNMARQMPNHFGKKELNMVTPSSTVGNQIPEAAGTALASKLRGEDAVSVVFFGEGAASQGDFHVGMNMAGVYNTPTIFFCENNQYAISVPMKLQAAAEAISMEACGYEFDGFRVDGNDVLAVYDTTRKAAAKARSGGGPSLIEALTYRLGAHSSSDDPARYRSQQEVEEWRKRDPIARLLGYLKYKGYYSEEWQEKVAEQIKDEIKTAIAKVEEEPAPEPETMFSEVFSQIPWHLENQKRELLEHLSERAESGEQGGQDG